MSQTVQWIDLASRFPSVRLLTTVLLFLISIIHFYLISRFRTTNNIVRAYVGFLRELRERAFVLDKTSLLHTLIMLQIDYKMIIITYSFAIY